VHRYGWRPEHLERAERQHHTERRHDDHEWHLHPGGHDYRDDGSPRIDTRRHRYRDPGDYGHVHHGRHEWHRHDAGNQSRAREPGHIDRDRRRADRHEWSHRIRIAVGHSDAHAALDHPIGDAAELSESAGATADHARRMPDAVGGSERRGRDQRHDGRARLAVVTLGQ